MGIVWVRGPIKGGPIKIPLIQGLVLLTFVIAARLCIAVMLGVSGGMWLCQTRALVQQKSGFTHLPQMDATTKKSGAFVALFFTVLGNLGWA